MLPGWLRICTGVVLHLRRLVCRRTPVWKMLFECGHVTPRSRPAAAIRQHASAAVDKLCGAMDRWQRPRGLFDGFGSRDATHAVCFCALVLMHAGTVAGVAATQVWRHRTAPHQRPNWRTRDTAVQPPRAGAMWPWCMAETSEASRSPVCFQLPGTRWTCESWTKRAKQAPRMKTANRSPKPWRRPHRLFDRFHGGCHPGASASALAHLQPSPKVKGLSGFATPVPNASA